MIIQFPFRRESIELYGYWSKPWHLVNPKIAGKWMFIPLELIIIGFDPPPYAEPFELEIDPLQVMPTPASRVEQLPKASKVP